MKGDNAHLWGDIYYGWGYYDMASRYYAQSKADYDGADACYASLMP